MSNVGAMSAINNVAEVYTATKSTTAKEDAVAKKEDSKAAEEGVVYEKSKGSEKKATYSVNKMSAEERETLVKQLKQDQADRQQSLMNIVKEMMSKQATVHGQANAVGTEDMWKFLAEGKFEVDAETKEQAQKDIAEDGYYGIKQTSERLFDFASALAGDDEKQMKKMQEAVEKGFKEATKTWGKDLPDICKDTLDATNKMFEDYYNSKTVQES